MRCTVWLSMFTSALVLVYPTNVLVNRVELTSPDTQDSDGRSRSSIKYEYRYKDGDTVELLCISMDVQCRVQWIDYVVYDAADPGGKESSEAVGLRATLRAAHNYTHASCRYTCDRLGPQTNIILFIYDPTINDILNLNVNDVTMRPQVTSSNVKYTISYTGNEQLTFKCATNRKDVRLKEEHQGQQWQVHSTTDTQNEMILPSIGSLDEDYPQLTYTAIDKTTYYTLYTIEIDIEQMPGAITNYRQVKLADDKFSLKSYNHKEDQQIFRGYRDGDSYTLNCSISGKNRNMASDGTVKGTKNIHVISAFVFDKELSCVSETTPPSKSTVQTPPEKSNVRKKSNNGHVPAPPENVHGLKESNNGRVPAPPENVNGRKESNNGHVPAPRVKVNVPKLRSSGDVPAPSSSDEVPTSTLNELDLATVTGTLTTATDIKDGDQRNGQWVLMVVGVFCIVIVCIFLSVYIVLKSNKQVQKLPGDSNYGHLQGQEYAATKSYPRPRLELHYAAPVDQREEKIIYCEPWQPEVSTLTSQEQESTPELNYAVLDIPPSSNVPNTVISEESPYAEVCHDVKARLRPRADVNATEQ